MTVTVTSPVVAKSGTTATICVLVADVIEPAVPLNSTESFATVEKFVPTIVTDVPIAPLVGEKLVIVGGVVTV